MVPKGRKLRRIPVVPKGRKLRRIPVVPKGRNLRWVPKGITRKNPRVWVGGFSG